MADTAQVTQTAKPELRPLNAEADRLEAFLNALVTHLQKRGVLIPDFDTSDIRREGNEDRLAAAAAFIADLTDMRHRFMATIH